MVALTTGRVLILGGARSGKSAFAETLVRGSGLSPTYLATGRAFDSEMQERIQLHRQQRGDDWTTLEEPLDLTGALRRQVRDDRAILVDCLTLWVTNLMMADKDVTAHGDRLCECLDALPGLVVFVSNEVGMGIVPDNEMAREFRDHTGLLHQKIARHCAQVFFVAAGIPMQMKG